MEFAGLSNFITCGSCGHAWGHVTLEAGNWLPLPRPCAPFSCTKSSNISDIGGYPQSTPFHMARRLDGVVNKSSWHTPIGLRKLQYAWVPLDCPDLCPPMGPTCGYIFIIIIRRAIYVTHILEKQTKRKKGYAHHHGFFYCESVPVRKKIECSCSYTPFTGSAFAAESLVSLACILGP